MCERSSDCNTPPELADLLNQPCGYRVTEEGLKALEEYEKLHGKAAVEAVPLADVPGELAESIEADAWRDRKRRRRREARHRGHRLLTVCGRWRAGQRIPDIRLCGLWLKKAGFDLGQELEVEVEAGALTIRAV